MRIFLAIALLLNALAPFAVQAAVGAREDKILICTAEGFRFVSAKEYSLPGIPATKHAPKCMLCVLAGSPVSFAPMAAVQTAVMPRIAAFAPIEIPERALAIPLFRLVPLGSRAPPSFV